MLPDGPKAMRCPFDWAVRGCQPVQALIKHCLKSLEKPNIAQGNNGCIGDTGGKLVLEPV
jgi:hypothetical protein